MLTSSFISEEGIDVEIAGGTASNPADQGGHETVEEKPTEPVEPGTPEDEPQGDEKGGSGDEDHQEAGDEGKPGDAPKNPPEGSGYDPRKVQRKFDRLKRNHAAKIQKRDAKIADLSESLEKANQEIERLKKKVEEGSATESELRDAEFDKRIAEHDLAREREEKASEYQENIRELVSERIRTLYPNEKAIGVYRAALSRGEQNGAFKRAMGDKVVREFIVDSDLGPKLTEHFCNRPEVLDNLLGLSEERRKHELYSMEARLSTFLSSPKKKAPAKETNTDNPPPAKSNQAPVIGKQANRGKANPTENDWDSDEELLAFARSHR